MQSYFRKCVPIIFFWVLLFGMGQAADSFKCWTDTAVTTSSLPGKDTLKAVVIYACGSNASNKFLPSWWSQIWDSTGGDHWTVPWYYQDNSMGKYKLTAVPHGRGILCYYSTDSITGGSSTQPDADFSDSILFRADSFINFVQFDNDGPTGNPDGIVDAYFLVVVNHGGFNGVQPSGSSYDYITRDTSPVTGAPVRIDHKQMAVANAGNRERAVAISAHEWCHALGPKDFRGKSSGGPEAPPWWGLGSFSLMGTGFPLERATPLDPYHRIKLGWVISIDVDTPLYQRSIPDYLTTGTVYRLKKSADEYFLVTNHRGVRLADNPAAFWEDKFTGFGILLWHIDETGLGGSFPSPGTFYSKRIDVELAHGLWDLSGFTPDTTRPNPAIGKDSLDIRSPDETSLYGYPDTLVQSATCFYNSVTQKTTFDGLSNPNSHGYKDSTILIGIEESLLVKVNGVPSHLAVRKIQSSQFSSATADLLVNNWFGHITQNTTWGPGAYAITGDITVDSGKTLTIKPGTTIYFQKNEDNQNAGEHSGKCEIKVARGGTLIARGKLDSLIVFVSSSSTPSDSDWHSIQVESGGSAKFFYAQFKNAYTAINYKNSAADTVKNCLFQNDFMHGIITKNSNLAILNSSFKDIAEGWGIYLDSANATVSGDTLNNVKFGINSYKSFGAYSNNVITTSGVGAVMWFGFRQEGSVSGSQQSNFSNDSISGKFMNAAIVANGGTSISGCKIWLNGPIPDVGDSIPQMIGIWSGGGNQSKARTTTVKMNSNLGNVPAVKVSGTPVIDLEGTAPTGNCCSEGNRIFRATSSSKAVENTTASTVLARYNWWGGTPTSSFFSGPVTYQPYLTCDPTPPSSCQQAKVSVEEASVPKQFSLDQNYPNPFNPRTSIRFSLPQAGRVRILVFNLLGQQVKTLVDGERLAGFYQVEWDGTDEKGVPVSSGMYFYKIEAGEYRKVNRMILLK